MVNVTEKAVTELKNLLEKQNKKGYGLRIFVAGVGCGGPQYGLALEEKPKKEDDFVENDGIKIIFAKNIAHLVESTELDFIETPQGSGFLIRNPNASCGPGCSSCH